MVGNPVSYEDVPDCILTSTTQAIPSLQLKLGFDMKDFLRDWMNLTKEFDRAFCLEYLGYLLSNNDLNN